ncbi:MAG: hypothetical protein H7Z72_22900 [Bacteroidetes bacterium]|nr:hypothetical protein [Fibrella sp.]
MEIVTLNDCVGVLPKNDCRNLREASGSILAQWLTLGYSLVPICTVLIKIRIGDSTKKAQNAPFIGGYMAIIQYKNIVFSGFTVYSLCDFLLSARKKVNA